MKKLPLSFLIFSIITTLTYTYGFSQEDDPTVRRAIYMINKGECDQALKMLDISLTRFGESEMIYLYKGQSYACLYMFEDALENYNKAIELNDKYSKAYISRGKLYIDQNKKEEGCADLKMAFDLGYEKDKEFFMENCPENAKNFIKKEFAKNTYDSDLFTAQFPVPIDVTTKQVEGKDVISIISERAKDYYLIVVWKDTDLGDENEKFKYDFLERMGNSFFEAMYSGGEIVTVKTDLFGDYVIDIAYATGSETALAKLFISGNNVYLLSHVSLGIETNTTELEIFYSSFMLK